MGGLVRWRGEVCGFRWGGGMWVQVGGMWVQVGVGVVQRGGGVVQMGRCSCGGCGFRWGEGCLLFVQVGVVGSGGGGYVGSGGGREVFRCVGGQWGEGSKGANVRVIEGEQMGKRWGGGGRAQRNLLAISFF